jgi:hypothetical protein
MQKGEVMLTKSIEQKALQLFRLIVIGLLIGACAPTVSEVPMPATSTVTQLLPTATQYICKPSPVLRDSGPYPEIQGTMKTDGELWALPFFANAIVDEEMKIVWRITGEGGEFAAQAQSEDGTIIQPVWEEYHESSTWERPGEEWGTGFNFPAPGCWTITVTYGETVGTIALEIYS